MPSNNYTLIDSSVLIDDNADGNRYVGLAVPGVNTVAGRALPQWSILRINVTGTIKEITYAGGTDNYDQVWDDRTSLGYS